MRSIHKKEGISNKGRKFPVSQTRSVGHRMRHDYGRISRDSMRGELDRSIKLCLATVLILPGIESQQGSSAMASQHNGTLAGLLHMLC